MKPERSSLSRGVRFAAALGARPASAQPFAYVSNEWANEITVIDVATKTAVATIPVGKRPRGLGLSPDGRHLYAALGSEDAIAIVDTAERKVIGRIPAGSDPEMFALSPDGSRIYASNEDANSASAIDVRARRVIASVPVGIEPEGVAVSPDGKWIYVTSESTHTVSIIQNRPFKVADDAARGKPAPRDRLHARRLAGRTSRPRSEARSRSSTSRRRP